MTRTERISKLPLLFLRQSWEFDPYQPVWSSSVDSVLTRGPGFSAACERQPKDIRQVRLDRAVNQSKYGHHLFRVQRECISLQKSMHVDFFHINS